MTENTEPTAATPTVHGGKRAAYFGMGVLLVLAGALGIGGWGAYQERHAALQTSQRHHDFVPTVQVAEVRSAGDTFTVCTDCVFDIYRSERADASNGTVEPTFTPSATNRIAQGVSGLEFTDTNLQLGQVYYYIVQARNAAGKKDTNDAGNTQARYNMPSINSFKPVAPFSTENFESSSADSRFQPPLPGCRSSPRCQ